MAEIVKKEQPPIIVPQSDEKEKNLACIATYPDTDEILSNLAQDFFKKIKIPISQKNINQEHQVLPSNLQRSFNYDSGFVSDVVDEFNLSWIGQALEQGSYDMSFMNKPVDRSYDPYAPDNIAGYENFAGMFTEVRNKEHHDFLKLKIQTNLDRRTRLDSSERGILPALVAGLGDPINYVPIPFVKGIGFAQRAVKGGAVATGLVGVTEPIRRNLDPTSTNQETMMYLGGSFLLGGLLTGFLGRSGAKIASETVAKKGGVKGIGEKYMKAHASTDGRKDFESTGFNYKVEDDVANVSVAYNKNKNGELVSYTGTKTNKLIVDYIKIRNIFQNNKHLFPKLKGVAPLPKKFFKNADDYMQFLMKKEILKKVYGGKKGLYARGKDEPLATYENRLNNAALSELRQQGTADLKTQANGFFRWVEGWTN